MKSSKIFCIGFQKTGTSSLDKALRILGYRVCGTHGLYDPSHVYEEAFELINKFDAFQNMPWPILYKELDKRCPDSKFILTLRPTDSWISSMTNTFYTEKTPMRHWIYGVGCPKGNEETYIKRYEQHNTEVLEYFKNRPRDLLVFHLTEGEGWEKLCPFLNKEIPSCEFPFVNKGLGKYNPLGIAKRTAKRILPERLLRKWRQRQASKYR